MLREHYYHLNGAFQMQKTKRSAANRSLRVEQLDNRLLLAGDCAVAVDSGGDLSIDCDQEDNFVAISQDPLGGLSVEGRFGTSINGVVDDTFDAGIVDDLEIRMRKGNDTVILTGAPSLPGVPPAPDFADDLFVALGQGNDTLIAGFLSVSDTVDIRGGHGNDEIGLLGVSAGDDIKARAGRGDDTVSANLVEAPKTTLRGGRGTDALVLGSVIGELVTSGFETDDTDDEGGEAA